MKTNKLFLGFVLFALIKIALAAPPYQTIEYRGIASINSTPVPDGTEISIWANSGTLKMHSVFTQFGIGFYDHLELKWDNAATPADEGITPDDFTYEQIKFKVGNYFTTTPVYKTEGLSTQGTLIILDLDVNTSIDMQSPIITLISPANNTVDTDGNINFDYNVTDQTGIANCSLFLNSAEYANDTTVQLNITQTFAITSLADNTYSWYIRCYDNSSNNNPGVSETRTITVNTTAPYYLVAIATDWPLRAGKPTGINITVNTSTGAAVQQAKVRVTETNGYAAFALTQKTIANVTNYVTAETYTNNNGFVRFTIVPTGGADNMGYENYIGNYSVIADVYVNNILVNTTALNVTQRTLLSATSIVSVPNQGDVNNFRIRLANVFQRLTDWLV